MRTFLARQMPRIHNRLSPKLLLMLPMMFCGCSGETPGTQTKPTTPLDETIKKINQAPGILDLAPSEKIPTTDDPVTELKEGSPPHIPTTAIQHAITGLNPARTT